MGFEVIKSGYRFQLGHLLAVSPEVNYVCSPPLIFPTGIRNGQKKKEESLPHKDCFEE